MTSPGNDFTPIAPRRRFPFGPRPSGVPSGSPVAPRSRDWIGYVATAMGGGLVVALLLVGGWLLVVDRAPRPVPPVPVPAGPLRVILVSDSTANMSAGQLDALSSTAVRGWLKTNCPKDADGNPAWRSWPPDVDPSGEPEVWRKAWATAKPLLGPLPGIVIFHGEHAQAFPLPDSEKGLLDLLAKQGAK